MEEIQRTNRWQPKRELLTEVDPDFQDIAELKTWVQEEVKEAELRAEQMEDHLI